MKTEFKAVKKSLSPQPELRQDLTSGEWILFSSRRDARPNQFKSIEKIRVSPKSKCVFENPKKAGGGSIIASYPDPKNWTLQIIPNKYPAVSEGRGVITIQRNGPYSFMGAYGHHEVAITKDHNTNFPKLSIVDANMLFNAFRQRYQEIAKDKNTAYVSIFHNWGAKTGASVYHPHYQILSTPIIPPSAERALKNANEFYFKNKRCVHCMQIEWAKQNKRIIHEDELSVAFAPYAPKEPFEFRVSPKGHSPFFEDSSEYEIHSIVKSLQGALRKLEKKIPHVNYNFYIHTAPAKDKKSYTAYHWHVQVIPREVTPHLGMTGGFELATGIEINSVLPEDAVKVLNGK